LRLVWRKAYECGQSTIDEQHRRLFECANNLLTAFIDGRPKDEVMSLLDTLIANVVKHFRHEEGLLRRSGYPHAEEHARVHDALIARAVELTDRYREDKLALGELFDFLARRVVAQHILSEDRKFFPYLKASELN